MKKIIFLFTFCFLINVQGYLTSAYSSSNIQLLEKINLTLDSKPKDSLISLKNYHNSNCIVSFTKKGKIIPTDISFLLSDNLRELYDFFFKYNRPISIKCDNYKYKTLTALNEYTETKINLNFSICKNEITQIKLYTFLNDKIYGEKPEIYKKWVKLFRSFSSKEPRVEKRTENIKNFTRVVWADTKILNNSSNEITFNVIKSDEAEQASSYSHNFTQVSLVNAKKIARCYLN